MQFNQPEIKIDGVIEYETVDVLILFTAITTLSGKLAAIPSTLENIKGHGHKYLIMNDTDYQKLDGVAAAIKTPKHPGAFTATNAAGTGKYQTEILQYFTHESVKAELKEWLKKSFNKSGVLHDLEAHDGSIKETPLEIIDHLWEQIPEHEKQRAVNDIEKHLDIEWNRDQPVQKYMKHLQVSKWQLTQLKSNPGTPKIIRKVVCTMEQHLDMDKSVKDWRKQSSPDKKDWGKCKKHFQAGLRDVENNPAYKKQAGYAKQAAEVKEEIEEMRENHRFLANQIIEHKKVIEKYEERANQVSQEFEEFKKTPKTSNTSQKSVKDMTEKERKKYYFDMFSARQPTQKLGGKPNNFFYE